MNTRLHVSVLVLVLMSVSALALTGKWETLRYGKWGVDIQIPAGREKQDLPTQPDGTTCELYAVGGLACFIRVTPTPDTQLASTAIEQDIQAEVKSASKLGAVKRWEENSKQGDLFKGFVGPVKLDGGDPLQAGIGKIIGTETGTECVSMAPLGDDTAPVLRIGVVGPADKQEEIAATAKEMAALVKRDNASPKVDAAGPGPEPPPASKPWPALKKGEIELEGTVESIFNDRRVMSLRVDFIKLSGQDRIALSPPRSKEVFLGTRPDWIAVGQRVILIGKNTGVGKPMTADVIERLGQ